MRRLLVAATLFAAATHCFGAISYSLSVGSEPSKSNKFNLTGFKADSVSDAELKGQSIEGHRKWKEISITRKVDVASPSFIHYVTATPKYFKITASSVGADGMPKLEYSVEFTGVVVTHHTETHGVDTITFTFQKITWTWAGSGKIFKDDWEAATF